MQKRITNFAIEVYMKDSSESYPLCCCLFVSVFQKHCKGNIKSDILQIITLYLTLLNIMERVIDIAALRKAKKIKQAEMADLFGINQSQISEIERGIRPVSTKYEEILIEQFGKDVCDNFRVASSDNRRLSVKGDVSVSGNGSIQDTNKTIVASHSDEDNLQAQLDECRAELAKTKKDLEQANKRIDKLLSIIENLSKE